MGRTKKQSNADGIDMNAIIKTVTQAVMSQVDSATSVATKKATEKKPLPSEQLGVISSASYMSIATPVYNTRFGGDGKSVVGYRVTCKPMARRFEDRLHPETILEIVEHAEEFKALANKILDVTAKA